MRGNMIWSRTCLLLENFSKIIPLLLNIALNAWYNLLLHDSVRKDKYKQLNKFKHSTLITDCNRKLFQTLMSHAGWDESHTLCLLLGWATKSHSARAKSLEVILEVYVRISSMQWFCSVHVVNIKVLFRIHSHKQRKLLKPTNSCGIVRWP